LVLFRIIDKIFSEVDPHIEDGTIIREYKMSALPTLYDLFVKLIKYLVIFEILFGMIFSVDNSRIDRES